uniref:Uncharacterized protein n=1 Tax=Cacopsylla melanoneura TaxID=428564 RepID=A0A8D9EX82_9HEMI
MSFFFRLFFVPTRIFCFVLFFTYVGEHRFHLIRPLKQHYLIENSEWEGVFWEGQIVVPILQYLHLHLKYIGSNISSVGAYIYMGEGFLLLLLFLTILCASLSVRKYVILGR